VEGEVSAIPIRSRGNPRAERLPALRPGLGRPLSSRGPRGSDEVAMVGALSQGANQSEAA